VVEYIEEHATAHARPAVAAALRAPARRGRAPGAGFFHVLLRPCAATARLTGVQGAFWDVTDRRPGRGRADHEPPSWVG